MLDQIMLPIAIWGLLCGDAVEQHDLGASGELAVSIQVRRDWPADVQPMVRIMLRPQRGPAFDWGAIITLSSQRAEHAYWVTTPGAVLELPADSVHIDTRLVAAADFARQGLRADGEALKACDVAIRRSAVTLAATAPPEWGEVLVKLKPTLSVESDRLLLSVEKHLTRRTEMTGVAFGVQAHLYVADELVASTAIRWLAGNPESDLFYPPGELPRESLDALSGGQRVVVRLEGQEALALPVASATKYWSGTATLEDELVILPVRDGEGKARGG